MAALRTNDDYDDLFDKYGQIYNVDPALTKTVFHLESSGNPGTKNSSAGAQGGMQIMPQLAAHYGIDPHDMTQANPAASAYLAEGLQATGGDPAGALAYYNGGPATLQRWKPETQGYVSKALSYYPQMKLAANAPSPGTATDTPVQYADAGPAPDVAVFRKEWGLDGSAPAASSPNVDAFRKEWNIPATAPAATTPRPVTPSDSAASSADRLPPPPDSALTTAQIAESRARIAQSPYASLEPSEPGFAHLMWSMGAPFMNLGETALGYKPAPTGVNALAAVAPLAGVGDLRFGGPLTARPTARPSPASPDVASGAPIQNPLASPAVTAEVPPSFGPGVGRTFDVDAQGNVRQSGASLVSRGAPEPAPGAAPVNPLVSPAAAPTPVAAPGRSLALSPAEQLIAQSIKARPPPVLPSGAPTSGGAVPPGWAFWQPGASGYTGAPPPVAPPGAVPGYTPTTPGVSPTATAGLSPAEIAAYASMHDTPPPAPMIPPQTKVQADALADQVIRHFHTGNPPIAPADLVVPPGYHPTLTGLTNDPGLATLHRGLESVSGTPAVIAQHNAQAINAAAGQLVGQPGDVAAMEAARDAVTGPMREAAFANSTDADPQKVQAVVSAADKILAGPDGKRPGVVKYITQIRDSLRSDTGNGAPESDPEMLYGVHKAVNDLLSPLAQSTDADKQAAAASLMKLKPLLQTAIESGASGFKDYMAKHAELSKPIDAQKFLQSLNLTNATGDVRLQAVDSAIKNIQKQQQLPGVPKAKWVSDPQMDQLVALRNALRMEASRGTGKPINSTTFQNLATNSIVSRIAGNPLTNLAAGWAYSPGITGTLVAGASKMAIDKSLARSEGMVKDALLERLLNFSGKGEATLAGNPTLASGPRANRPGPGAPWNPLSSGPTPGMP